MRERSVASESSTPGDETAAARRHERDAASLATTVAERVAQHSGGDEREAATGEHDRVELLVLGAVAQVVVRVERARVLGLVEIALRCAIREHRSDRRRDTGDDER